MFPSAFGRALKPQSNAFSSPASGGSPFGGVSTSASPAAKELPQDTSNNFRLVRIANGRDAVLSVGKVSRDLDTILPVVDLLASSARYGWMAIGVSATGFVLAKHKDVYAALMEGRIKDLKVQLPDSARIDIELPSRIMEGGRQIQFIKAACHDTAILVVVADLDGNASLVKYEVARVYALHEAGKPIRPSEMCTIADKDSPISDIQVSPATLKDDCFVAVHHRDGSVRTLDLNNPLRNTAEIESLLLPSQYDYSANTLVPKTTHNRYTSIGWAVDGSYLACASRVSSVARFTTKTWTPLPSLPSLPPSLIQRTAGKTGENDKPKFRFIRRIVFTGSNSVSLFLSPPPVPISKPEEQNKSTKARDIKYEEDDILCMVTFESGMGGKLTTSVNYRKLTAEDEDINDNDDDDQMSDAGSMSGGEFSGGEDSDDDDGNGNEIDPLTSRMTMKLDFRRPYYYTESVPSWGKLFNNGLLWLSSRDKQVSAAIQTTDITPKALSSRALAMNYVPPIGSASTAKSIVFEEGMSPMLPQSHLTGYFPGICLGSTIDFGSPDEVGGLDPEGNREIFDSGMPVLFVLDPEGALTAYNVLYLPSVLRGDKCSALITERSVLPKKTSTTIPPKTLAQTPTQAQAPIQAPAPAPVAASKPTLTVKQEPVIVKTEKATELPATPSADKVKKKVKPKAKESVRAQLTQAENENRQYLTKHLQYFSQELAILSQLLENSNEMAESADKCKQLRYIESLVPPIEYATVQMLQLLSDSDAISLDTLNINSENVTLFEQLQSAQSSSFISKYLERSKNAANATDPQALGDSEDARLQAASDAFDRIQNGLYSVALIVKRAQGEQVPDLANKLLDSAAPILENTHQRLQRIVKSLHSKVEWIDSFENSQKDMINHFEQLYTNKQQLQQQQQQSSESKSTLDAKYNRQSLDLQQRQKTAKSIDESLTSAVKSNANSLNARVRSINLAPSKLATTATATKSVSSSAIEALSESNVRRVISRFTQRQQPKSASVLSTLPIAPSQKPQQPPLELDQPLRFNLNDIRRPQYVNITDTAIGTDAPETVDVGVDAREISPPQSPILPPHLQPRNPKYAIYDDNNDDEESEREDPFTSTTGVSFSHDNNDEDEDEDAVLDTGDYIAESSGSPQLSAEEEADYIAATTADEDILDDGLDDGEAFAEQEEEEEEEAEEAEEEEAEEEEEETIRRPDDEVVSRILASMAAATPPPEPASELTAPEPTTPTAPAATFTATTVEREIIAAPLESSSTPVAAPAPVPVPAPAPIEESAPVTSTETQVGAFTPAAAAVAPAAAETTPKVGGFGFSIGGTTTTTTATEATTTTTTDTAAAIAPPPSTSSTSFGLGTGSLGLTGLPGLSGGLSGGLTGFRPIERSDSNEMDSDDNNNNNTNEDNDMQMDDGEGMKDVIDSAQSAFGLGAALSSGLGQQQSLQQPLQSQFGTGGFGQQSSFFNNNNNNSAPSTGGLAFNQHANAFGASTFGQPPPAGSSFLTQSLVNAGMQQQQQQQTVDPNQHKTPAGISFSMMSGNMGLGDPSRQQPAAPKQPAGPVGFGRLTAQATGMSGGSLSAFVPNTGSSIFDQQPQQLGFGQQQQQQQPSAFGQPQQPQAGFGQPQQPQPGFGQPQQPTFFGRQF
ncbi:hypothetical protein GQ42DRAFT_164569 [Ramicandelaber brevisporus]|nr:hypothetical protein GQ42DRAFT_164569 [Ramicandelaber brevisporus]